MNGFIVFFPGQFLWIKLAIVKGVHSPAKTRESSKPTSLLASSMDVLRLHGVVEIVGCGDSRKPGFIVTGQQDACHRNDTPLGAEGSRLQNPSKQKRSYQKERRG
jgi:hypothetical protein